MNSAPKIVLSGEIGSGKTTIVRAAMQLLGWERPGGFFTHWDGAGRGAQNLYFETWRGAKHLMARRDPAAPDAVPYELAGATFVRVAVASLAEAAAGRPVVIDELGLIELAAAGFPEAVARLFRGPAPVLAVIQQRAMDRWLALIDRMRVTRRVDATLATRDALPAQIAAWFGA
jgi:nucleoside-triphosphatase THEP1